MIRYAQGDIFSVEADIRINTVNCVGVMGAGVALAFKNRYPEMFKEYAKACKAGEVRPGRPHVWEQHDFYRNITIVNFPTKDHWRQPSKYEYIEQGLQWLRDFVAKRGNVRVAVPALGCGHGGLDWSRVRNMIETSLGDLDAEIIIFEPSSSRAVDELADEVTFAQLDDLGIERLRPGDDGYPDTLRGRSDATLYVKGKVSVLNERVVAVISSIKPSDLEINSLLTFVKELNDPSIHIMTGYSPNSDRLVIRAILEQGAHVIICIVEGILLFKVRQDLQDVWDDTRVTVISTAKPRQKWYAGGTGKATAIKLALSGATVISDPSPVWLQSFVRNHEKEVRSKLFHFNYGDMQEDVKDCLRQLKSKPLGKIRESGKPNIAKVLAAFAPPDQEMKQKDTEPMKSAQVDEKKEESIYMSESTDAITTGESKVTEEDMKSKETKEQDIQQPIIHEDKKDGNIRYPKRLIEVDLPIKRISEHARREKSIRHGHISTLHIWWARRPLAACRAVICASLWPDPVDVTDEDAKQARSRGEDAQVNTCPPAFKKKARELMLEWVKDHAGLISSESHPRAVKIQNNPKLIDEDVELRKVLLDFIADFANWDNSTVKEYLETARALTQSAHEALGGAPGTRPLVVDPFAGGGAIPLESLRVGADAFASDLNPVAVLLNKVVLEYIPKYGQRLADEVRKWGEWVKKEAEKELTEFYPEDTDGSTPMAYIWARTIMSEAPGKDVFPTEIPLLRSMWLSNKPNRRFAFRWVRDAEGRVKTETAKVVYADGIERMICRPIIEIFQPKSPIDVEKGTSKGGAATCPLTGYTTSVERVREQLKTRYGGSSDARLLCVVLTSKNASGRVYRCPNETDLMAALAAKQELDHRIALHHDKLSLLPEEKQIGRAHV